MAIASVAIRLVKQRLPAERTTSWILFNERLSIAPTPNVTAQRICCVNRAKRHDVQVVIAAAAAVRIIDSRERFLCAKEVLLRLTGLSERRAFPET